MICLFLFTYLFTHDYRKTYSFSGRHRKISFLSLLDAIASSAHKTHLCECNSTKILRSFDSGSELFEEQTDRLYIYVLYAVSQPHEDCWSAIGNSDHVFWVTKKVILGGNLANFTHLRAATQHSFQFGEAVCGRCCDHCQEILI